MQITKKLEGTKLTVAIAGRLDTVTSPELETFLASALADVTDLVIDFSAMDYISSAGLRVMLSVNKKMLKVGTMTLTGLNDVVRDIFDMTGFSDIFTIV